MPSDQTSDTKSARVPPLPPNPIDTGCRLWPGPDAVRTVSTAVQCDPARTASRVPIPEVFDRR